MTLIARAKWGPYPVYVGDVLLSTQQKPPEPVGIPALKDVNAYLSPSSPGRYVSGTVQKVNILSERLVIAFAGAVWQARPMARDLLAAVEAGIRTGEEALDIIMRVPERERDNLAIMGTIVNFRDGKVNLREFSYECERIEKDEVVAHVAGSGAEAVRHHLSHMIDQVKKNAPSEPQPHHAAPVNLAVLLGGEFAGNEMATGENLSSWFGGAFEMAMASDDGFIKYSDFLQTAWFIEKRGDEGYVLKFIPRLTKYDYVGKTLIVSVLDLRGEGGKVEVHHIAPLLGASPVKAENLSFNYRNLTCHILIPDRINGRRSIVYRAATGNDQFRIHRNDNTVRLEIQPALISRLKQIGSTELGVDIL